MSKKKITTKQKRKKKVKEKKNSSFTRGNLQTKGNNVQTRLWQKKKKKDKPMCNCMGKKRATYWTSPCASACIFVICLSNSPYLVFFSFCWENFLIGSGRKYLNSTIIFLSSSSNQTLSKKFSPHFIFFFFFFHRLLNLLY